jgi:hypothetical protein
MNVKLLLGRQTEMLSQSRRAMQTNEAGLPEMVEGTGSGVNWKSACTSEFKFPFQIAMLATWNASLLRD